MKKLLILLLLISIGSHGQNYVDVLKIGYYQGFETEFEDSNGATDIDRFEIGTTFPIVLNEKHAIITGFDFSQNEILLSPSFNMPSKFYNSLLKLGLSTTHSDKWSSTFILLPKLASDYENTTHRDVFVGIYAVGKLKKRENLYYRFGLYSSFEPFGLIATPIFGVYYTSPNQLFEMDASLPITATLNYKLGATSIGFNYSGLSRGYNLNKYQNLPLYVEQSPLEFSSFIQYGLLNQSLLLRAKIGYSTNTYKVYEQGDKLDVRISGINFGDDRTQLNPTILGNAFFKIEAIYRVHFKN